MVEFIFNSVQLAEICKWDCAALEILLREIQWSAAVLSCDVF